MSIDFKPEWKNLQQPCEWKIVNKLAQCRAVLEDHIFSIFLSCLGTNLFLNNLEIDGHDDVALFKYAGDTTILVTFPRGLSDRSDFASAKFMGWMDANGLWMQTVNARNYFCIKKGIQQLIQYYTISSNIIVSPCWKL